MGRANQLRLLGKGIMFQTKKIVSYRQFQHPISTSVAPFLSSQSQIRRNISYVNRMRKSTIDDNTLRLLRNEIRYELDHSPLQQPGSEINGFKVDERAGEQWISLEKEYGEKEVIKIEVSMFNGSVPVPNEGEKKGLPGQEVQFHITMVVSIFKNNSNKVLEFICSAWPDNISISKLFVREQAKVPHQPYTGPKYRELDDELQDSLYEFLEERQIDDSLCSFLHKYVNYKEKAEYIRWMKTVKSMMEK
ncbi:uncharacterized protein At2g39795, mitochondrial [Spinacia oleracea]|uniref:Uncharacterized protein At2g39795, mitochondrial n=1 Tax=Spinacia oleracea TaxID=3562 RepID=A0A9R0JEL2_SPIOL|nr:uncharacterized protein At2g39795, mitochondrial [Spinacia oleracea]